MLLAEKNLIKKIISEVEKLETLEMESLLAYVSALNLKKNPAKPLAKRRVGKKPHTMQQIDKIKHKVRKLHAN